MAKLRCILIGIEDIAPLIFRKTITADIRGVCIRFPIAVPKDIVLSMINATWSVRIPKWKTIHFRRGRMIGESRPACFKGLAHYDRRNRSIGKSIRNFFGELNHYDNTGKCTGYSRRAGLGVTSHYSNRGKEIGCTYCLLGLIYVHR